MEKPEFMIQQQWLGICERWFKNPGFKSLSYEMRSTTLLAIAVRLKFFAGLETDCLT